MQTLDERRTGLWEFVQDPLGVHRLAPAMTGDSGRSDDSTHRQRVSVPRFRLGARPWRRASGFEQRSRGDRPAESEPGPPRWSYSNQVRECSRPVNKRSAMKLRTVIALAALSVMPLEAARWRPRQPGIPWQQPPRAETVNPRDPVVNFEHVWKTLDRNYGQFLVKHVDWDALYRVYRPQVDSGDDGPGALGHPAEHDGAPERRARVPGRRQPPHLRRLERGAKEGRIFPGPGEVQIPAGQIHGPLGGSWVSGWLAEGVGYLYSARPQGRPGSDTKTIDANS